MNHQANKPEDGSFARDQRATARGSRYYARQPILTADGKLFAYELLFRSGPRNVFSGDGVQATRTMLDNALMFGFERLTGGLPGFINCTEEAFTSQLTDLLPPKLAVLEILETLEPTPELIAFCHKAKARGFRLALDDFIWRPELAPLVEIADFIKVDFTLSGPKERRALIARLKSHPPKFLAEKVETLEEFEMARQEGFSYFQGYYFCKPTLITSGEIPPNKLAQLQVLRDLQRETYDLVKISRLVERDAALTYRLLRLVNSPLYAYRRNVQSVETALIVIGERAFRRVATLAIASALSTEATPALLRLALTRARFCELAAPFAGLDETEQYLLGMFSLLPAMLRIPMDQAIAPLELRAEIRSALVQKQNRERSLLYWIEASERGEWAQCDAVEDLYRLEPKIFERLAAEAIDWADKALFSVR